MLKCLECITKERKLIFAAGAAAGLALLKIAKTKKVRDLTVKSVASGLMVKDCVLENIANIREEAEDICQEAKIVAQKECCDDDSCSCDCNC